MKVPPCLPILLIFTTLVLPLGRAETVPAKTVEQTPVSWKDAARNMGKTVTISGTVVAAYKHKLYCMLHFHKDHPKHFTVIIHRRNFKRFPKDPWQYYLNKQVLVRGKVVEQGGRPAMVLNNRKQIWIVGEAIR